MYRDGLLQYIRHYEPFSLSLNKTFKGIYQKRYHWGTYLECHQFLQTNISRDQWITHINPFFPLPRLFWFWKCLPEIKYFKYLRPNDLHFLFNIILKSSMQTKTKTKICFWRETELFKVYKTWWTAIRYLKYSI